MTDATLNERLRPLSDVLRGRGLRVVARPGWVSLDRADGPQRIDIPWEESSHQEVLEALAEGPRRLEGGLVARRLGHHLIVLRPPDPLRRVDDLVAEGRVSSLGGQLLSAALGLGRNVLLLGPWAACLELGAALVAEGQRPGLWSAGHDPVPGPWPAVSSAAEVRTLGIDRFGAWGLDTEELAAVMGTGSGVVGWLDARRLDRGLIRFESAPGSPSGPMRVLAALDLVAVVALQPQPRVREIAEIALTEDGYRPLTLFATGHPPAPTALVPVAAPTFLDELRGANQSVLADELTHAVVYEPMPAAERRPSAAAAPSHLPGADHGPPPGAADTPPPMAVARSEPPMPEPTIHSVAGGSPIPNFRRAPSIEPAADDAPDPGWELDALGDEAIAQELASISDPDAAVMAASFGLGPPPRPSGMSGTGLGQNFTDALERARKRDAELQRSLEEDGGLPAGDEDTD